MFQSSKFEKMNYQIKLSEIFEYVSIGSLKEDERVFDANFPISNWCCNCLQSFGSLMENLCREMSCVQYEELCGTEQNFEDFVGLFL